MVVLCTSIPPSTKRPLLTGGLDVGRMYQSQCVRSWIDAGFRVISVNAADEVEIVAASFPEIEVIVATRDERRKYGRPLIPLVEILEALKSTGETVGGIINADIILVASEDFESCLKKRSPGEIAYIKREDKNAVNAARGHTYSFGIDVFVFDLFLLDTIDFSQFTLGIPWWDYYLPLACLLTGGKLVEWPSRFAQHLLHNQNWDKQLWRQFYHVCRLRLEKLLSDRVLLDQNLRDPIILYGLSQGGFYYQHYGPSCKGYDLDRTTELQMRDVDNHIVAYGYFILDFLSKMSFHEKGAD